MDNIVIFGGDKRQVELRKRLIGRGYKCDHINSAEKKVLLEKLFKYDTVIFPLPYSRDKVHVYSADPAFTLEVKDVISSLNSNQLVILPCADENIKNQLNIKGVKFYDFYESENFIIYNAFLTAQGGLRLLLDNVENIISGKSVLVTGYGRVAEYLADTLKRNRMDVCIAARDKCQRLKAECMGLDTIEIKDIKNEIFKFDYIFNTVPANIFSAEDISLFCGKYFELASAPFGVRREHFIGLSAEYLSGASLPGKYLPEASADLITESICEYIRIGGD